MIKRKETKYWVTSVKGLILVGKTGTKFLHLEL